MLNQYTPAVNPHCRTEKMPNKSSNHEQDNYKSLPDIHCKFIKSSQLFKEYGGEMEKDWCEQKSRLAKTKPNLTNFIGTSAFINKKDKEVNLNNFINVNQSKGGGQKDSQKESVNNSANPMNFNMSNEKVLDT